MLIHGSYLALVLVLNPTIPSDLKDLRSDQYKVREGATKRLESLSGWTVFYFEDCARKSKDLEVRMRCRRVCETLDWRLECDIDSFQEPFLTAKIKLATTAAFNRQLMPAALVNLAKLRAEDLQLAEAQGVCPFRDSIVLGGLGVPVKITLKGQPVLLCCRDCIKKAQADPDKTLAKVKELKAMPERILSILTEEQLQKVREAVKSSNKKKDRSQVGR